MSYNHNFSDANLNNLHSSMQYGTEGKPLIRTASDPGLSSGMTWLVAVGLGLVPGVTGVHRSAYNPDIAQNTEESIWSGGGLYPWSSLNGGHNLYVISTSAADTGQSIYIEGLDSNYNPITETVVTNGTTAVITTKSFARVHTATVTSGQANVGDITFRLHSDTGTVISHIRAGFSITKMSQYTVPAGKTAYILVGDATSFRGGSGNIGSVVKMMVRPYSGVFLVAHISEVVNGYYRYDFPVPMRVPEKSDIDIIGIADGNGTQMSCNYDIILVNNNS
jgi:hypothetical protein